MNKTLVSLSFGTIVVLVIIVIAAVFSIYTYWESYSDKQQVFIRYANTTCNYDSGQLLSLESPVEVRNYFIVNCISNDRTHIDKFYFTTTEFNDWYERDR